MTIRGDPTAWLRPHAVGRCQGVTTVAKLYLSLWCKCLNSNRKIPC